jgi:hypothetical protein
VTNITDHVRDSIRSPPALVFAHTKGENIVTSRMSSRAATAGVLAAMCMASGAHAAVTISSAATENMSCTAGVCSPTAANAVLNTGDLTSLLASGAVTVNTGTGSLASQVEDIIVASAFNWASANGLTLDAYRSVTISSGVVVNGPAPVNLVTNDGGSGGDLSFPSGGSLSFLGTANRLSINGAAYTLENSIATLASAIAANPSGIYALANAYNASGDGTYSASPIPTTFVGTFEGLGNPVQNLTIMSNASRGQTGLFSVMNGTARDIGLQNVNIGSSATLGELGALAGISYGTIDQAWVTGQVSDSGTVGGMVGENSGTIENSWSGASVTGLYNKFYVNAGGLVGANGGVINNSYATGEIKGSIKGKKVDDDITLGGLASGNGGTISNSHATGNVSNGAVVGGLVGGNGTTIVNCYATGNVTGASTAGGLVGYEGATNTAAIIEQSFATGRVTVTGTGILNGVAGGLLGTNQYGAVTNSYAEGSIKGNIVGGLVGWNLSYGAQYNPSTTTSYSTGAVSGTGDYDNVGGFFGLDDAPDSDQADDYWDTQTSNQMRGVGGGNIPEVIGLTNRQLKSGLPGGFDPTIWTQSPSINKGFPYLIANPPQ